MNRFKPYIPGNPNTEVIEFGSLGELTSIPHVNEAAHKRGFHRFSVDLTGKPSLMAEYDNGSHWEVLGYIQKPNELRLPTFRFRAVSMADC